MSYDNIGLSPSVRDAYDRYMRQNQSPRAVDPVRSEALRLAQAMSHQGANAVIAAAQMYADFLKGVERTDNAPTTLNVKISPVKRPRKIAARIGR